MIHLREQFPPFGKDVIIYSKGQCGIGKLHFLPYGANPGRIQVTEFGFEMQDGSFQHATTHSKFGGDPRIADLYWQELPDE